MTKFYDNNSILEIEMATWEGTGYSGAFEMDWIQPDSRTYDEDLEAYRVTDVQYVADYASDYVLGRNSDFDNWGKPIGMVNPTTDDFPKLEEGMIVLWWTIEPLNNI